MNSDEILEQELIKRNLITVEKLAEYKEELKQKPDKSFSDLLLEKKLLTEDEILLFKLPAKSEKDDYEQALADIEKILSLQNPKEVSEQPIHNIAETVLEEKKPASAKKTLSFEKISSGTLPDSAKETQEKPSLVKKTTSFESFSSSKPLDFGDEIQEKLLPPKKEKVESDAISSLKMLALGDAPVSSGQASFSKKTTSFQKISQQDAGMIQVPLNPVAQGSNIDPYINLPEIPKEETMDMPFGKACVLLRFATEEQVQEALDEQKKNPGKTLGEIMVAQKILTHEKVKTVLSRQKSETLICHACNKKYQIVLYQSGRSYKCKVCNRELEKFSEIKAKKKKESIDLMGLTQTFSVQDESKKIDTKGIDFEANPEAQNVLNTSDILKKVGMLNNIEHRKPLQFNKRKNYFSVAMGSIIVCLFAFGIYYLVFAFFFNIPEKIEKKPIHYTPDTKKYFPEETKKLDEAKKMEQAYQSLSEAKYPEENIDALKIGIESWQAFLDSYPQTDKREKITEEIYRLQDLLKKAVEKRDFLLFERKFGEKITGGDMAGAEKILAEYQNTSNDPFYQQQYSEKEKNLQAIAKESMQKDMIVANVLVQSKRFSEALVLLERNKKLQIVSFVPALEEKILQTKQIEEQFLWGNAALKISLGLYSLLMEKKYKQAISFLEKQSAEYPQYQNFLSQWKTELQKAELFWENCQNIFSQNKDKEMMIQITGQEEMKITPKSFSPKTEALVFLWEKKFKNIKLGQISNQTFKNLLLKPDSTKEEKAQLGLFLFFIKDPKSIREGFPEIFQSSFQSNLFLVYTLSSVFYMLEHKNFPNLEENLKDLSKHSSDALLYQSLKPEIAKKLWENSQDIEKMGRKKANKEMLLKMILEYLPDTPFAQQAKESMK